MGCIPPTAIFTCGEWNLTVLANSNVGIRHESSGEHGLAQARRMESKSSGDAWYAEQRAKEAYEKETGKSWKNLPYGYQEDWRKKFPAKKESADKFKYSE